MKVKVIVSMILFPVLSVVGELRGDRWTFDDPKIDGYKINTCLIPGSSTNCDDGHRAAAYFCRTQGYKGVEGGNNYERDAKSSWHTNKFIWTGKIHHWFYGKSKSFNKITCEGEVEYKRVFHEPKYENYPLEYCLAPTVSCGKEVANAFCRMKGFKQAEFYTVATGWDGNSTKSIGTDLTCYTHLHHPCKTFDYITCSSNPQK